MKNKNYKVIFISLVFSSLFFIVNANATELKESNNNIDSLYNLLKSTKHDTTKINLYIDIIEQLRLSNTSQALAEAKKAYALSKKLNWEQGISKSTHALAISFESNNQVDSGIFYMKQSCEIELKRNDLRSLGISYNSLGLYYGKIGEIKKSYIYLKKALALSQQVNDKIGEGDAYCNMAANAAAEGNLPLTVKYDLLGLKCYEKAGNINKIGLSNNNLSIDYMAMEEYEEAIKYAKTAIEFCLKINDKINAAAAYLNLGTALFNLNKALESKQAIEAATQLILETNNKEFLIEAYCNMAEIYVNENNFAAASTNLNKAYDVAIEIKNNYSIIYILNEMGILALKQKKYTEAINKYKAALPLALKDSSLNELATIYTGLQDANIGLNNYKAAFEYTNQFNEINKLINNQEKIKQLARLRTEFETEKKQHQIELLNKDNKIKSSEIAKQKIVRNSFIVGFLIVLLFAFVFLNQRNKIRKEKNKSDALVITVSKQKEEVEEQKNIVQYQNEEILSSITYAKRIQATILPPVKVVKKYLEDSFILYLPKDIVAGDFYWMEGSSQNDQLILFAACDSTGHGVPGALVSVVCSNALNRAVKEFNLDQPAAILDKVCELVVNDFSKDELENVQDGMDVSLCALNVAEGILYWAGANNPLWIIRNNVLIEYKADKQPIGKYDDRKPFTNHEIKIEKGDTFYLFTDGYADQFGGEKNKKLTKAKFKETLLNMMHLNMYEQRNFLYDFHLNYKGDHEQVDDILILGVRV